MVILGLLYCSVSKVCSLDPKKVIKYSKRIILVLESDRTTSSKLEQLVGNLEFAAWVEPFGRPLLSFISRNISPDAPKRRVYLSSMMSVAMRVWLLLLKRNRGLRFTYILNVLPPEHRPIYVDAASTGGIGG